MAPVPQVTQLKLKNALSMLPMLALLLLNVSAQAQTSTISQTSTPVVYDKETSASQTLVSTNAELNPKKNQRLIRFRWKMGLGYDNFANEKDQATNTGLGLGADLRYGLIKTLELKVSAGANLASGYAQTRFGEFKTTNGFYLREAILRFRPIPQLSLNAGAINQDHLAAPLLVAAGPFPGGQEKLEIGGNDLRVQFIAQQTIPTSSSLSTKTVESEPTPTFMTETLLLSSKVIPNAELSLHAGHFAFRSLPSVIAFESSAFGNTVNDISPTSSRFAYEFDGWFAGAGSKVQFFDRVFWKLDAQMLQNTRAPETYRNGQLIKTGLEIDAGSGVKIEPSGGVFFSESDLSPAFYNSSELGHNNRQGWMVGFDTTLKQAGFKIGGAYVDSDVINVNALQSRQQYFKISFETLYDVF